MKCLLETACCGCSLKKCTIILGYIGIAFSVLGVIGSAYLLVAPEVAHDRERNSIAQNVEDHPLPSLIITSIFLIACILLIIGAKKGKPYLMLLWIIWMFLEVIGFGILSVASLVLWISNFTLENAIFTLIIFLASALCAYFWLVVVSHFAELRRES